MDPTYSGEGFDGTYSRASRSRASSGVSTTEGLLQSLQLAETGSLETGSYTSSTRPASSRGLASPAYLSPSLSSYSTSYLSTPLSQHQPGFPPLSSEEVASHAEWFDTEHPHSQGAPLLRLEPAHDHLGASPSSPPLTSAETEAMRYGLGPAAAPVLVPSRFAASNPRNSTVALSYDPAFNMGTRSSYTWPGTPTMTVPQHKLVVLTTETGMDTGSGLMPPDLGQYGSEASLTPPGGSRSVTASPPGTSLTAEQRELKRQRDQARHSSKMHSRGRRTDSASSVYSPPVTVADLASGASSMPVYTTAPSQISLLAEPSAPHYLPPFSPPLSDQNQAGMFTSSYPPQSYMPDYGYPASTAPSLPSHYGYAPPNPARAAKRPAASDMVLTEQQAARARPEPRNVLDAANHGPRTVGRERASEGGAQPAEAAVLGARMQRAAVFNIQQPPQAPAGKVRAGVQGELSQVRRRVYADDSEERSPPARQMQEEGLRLRQAREGTSERAIQRERGGRGLFRRHRRRLLCNIYDAVPDITPPAFCFRRWIFWSPTRICTNFSSR